jgi:hypothetical protein
MNKSDNGISAQLMGDTYIYRGEDRIVQSMRTLEGKPKGMLSVLLERGKVVGERILGTCGNCKQHIESDNSRCCCDCSEPDFYAQKVWIEKDLTRLQLGRHSVLSFIAN